MTQRISAREARSRFAEITDSVRYTGKPVIVEKQGRPFVAVISIEDLDALEQVRGERMANEFTRRAAEAAATAPEPPSEEEIVEALKKTREAIFRERYARE